MAAPVMIRFIPLVVLLVPSLLANDDFINCLGDNKCFGAPSNCDPNKDCHTLVHFDAQNSLNFHLRNFTASYHPRGYGSINLKDVDSASIIDHLACIPYEQKRLKVVSVEESPFQEIEEMSDLVLGLPNDEFMCTFFADQIPSELRNRDFIIAARGPIVPRVFQAVDPTSILLHPVTSSDPPPTSAALVAQDVLNVDENKMTTDLIHKITMIGKGGDEDMLDLLVNKKKTSENADEGDEDLESMLKPGKKFSTSGRKNEKRQKSSKKDEDNAREEEDDEEAETEEPLRKPKSRRPSRKEEEDVDEEEVDQEDEDEEDQGKRSSKRKPSRPSRYEEDEDEENEEETDEEQERKPKRKVKRPSRRDEDEEEEENEEEDEEKEEETDSKKKTKKNEDGKRRNTRRGGRMRDLEDEYEDENEDFYSDDYENAADRGFPLLVILLLIHAFILLVFSFF